MVTITPLFGRSRHIFAMPLLGTGYGGFHGNAGDVLSVLLPVLELKTKELGIDLAICFVDRDSYISAQHVRRQMHPRLESFYLRPDLAEEVVRLSNLAIKGKLAVFFGAGASMGSGLPSWASLLKTLAKEVGIVDQKLNDFEKLQFLDQALLIESRLANMGNITLGEAVAKELKKMKRVCLVHAFLAELPVSSFVTTNYDEIFEASYKVRANFARKDRSKIMKRLSGSQINIEPSSERLSIIPYGIKADTSTFLLKLHGCVSHPSDIVLTRKDYLRQTHASSVLNGVLQTSLLTKHLMYVGFSLTDPNFYATFDSVRQSFPQGSLCNHNTALLLKCNPLEYELWGGDVKIVEFSKKPDSTFPDLAIQQEIFLDVMNTLCCLKKSTSCLLVPRYESLLSEADKKLKNLILDFKRALNDCPEARRSFAYESIQASFARLGGSSIHGKQNMAGVPELKENETLALETLAKAIKEENEILYLEAFRLWEELRDIWNVLNKPDPSLYKADKLAMKVKEKLESMISST